MISAVGGDASACNAVVRTKRAQIGSERSGGSNRVAENLMLESMQIQGQQHQQLMDHAADEVRRAEAEQQQLNHEWMMERERQMQAAERQRQAEQQQYEANVRQFTPAAPAPPSQQSAPTTMPASTQPPSYTAPSAAASAPRPQTTPSQPQPQYRPSWTHRSDIEDRWQDSRKISSYAVKVSNTGDVRLFCRATASARVAYIDGGSCIGVSALNCTNGRNRSETRTSTVYPGATVTVVTLGDFLSDGRYEVSCNMDPS